MNSAARMSVVVLVAGVSLSMVGAGPQPGSDAAPIDLSATWVPLQTGGVVIPSNAPREARVTIGKREHTVSVTLTRLILGTIPIGFDGAFPVQAMVVINSVDGSAMESVSNPVLTVRGIRTAVPTLQENPTTQQLPLTGRSWSGMLNRDVKSDAPHATVTFRSRGKTYRVTFNGLAIQNQPLPTQ